jgi:Cys-rich repeat protein
MLPSSTSARCRPLAQASALAVLFFPVLLGARGCEYEVHCPAVADPVCGEDGTTYPGACEAHRAGVAVVHEGACGVVCAAVFDPVCGTDGRSYGNACEARRLGVGVAYAGECEAGCLCPANYAPVCGADGFTYGNDCEAACAGQAVVHAGACSCDEVLCDLACDFGFATDPATGCAVCACNPPPPAPCASDADCAEGEICFAPEVDCPPGAVCAAPVPFCVPAPLECGDVFCALECEFGFALDPMTGCPICACNPPPPALCTTDAECPSGFVCALDSFDCPPEALCAEGLGTCVEPAPEPVPVPAI